MSQLGLFRDGRRVLFDDATGTITYVPALIEPPVALAWFEQLAAGVEWRSERRRIFDLDLENGSLLLMSHETQKHYDHGIPKVRGEVGPRISLAFRVRPG